MTEGQRKTAGDLTAAEHEVLLRVCDLDCSPRGCFARRETLARMLDCSVSRVNHGLADLKRRGFVTVSARGRRRDTAAVIRVTVRGRRAANGLQGVCKQSGLVVHKVEYLVSGETTSFQPAPVHSAPNPEPAQDVVSVKSQDQHRENGAALAETVGILESAGVAAVAARVLAGRHPEARVRAAVRYVRQSRSEVLNAGGMVRAALEGKWRLPAWAYGVGEAHRPAGVGRGPSLAQMPGPAPAGEGRPGVACPAQPVCNEGDRAVITGLSLGMGGCDPVRVWQEALQVMASGQVLEAWAPPSALAGLRRCRLEEGPEGLQVMAPDGYREAVVRGYQAEMRAALEAVGMARAAVPVPAN